MTLRFVGLVTLGWALAVACAPGGVAPTAPAPDLILHSGRIITVDRDFSVAEAIAIAGDRILAVGTNADIRARAVASTRQIDLGGRAVTPGLMDNHLHAAGGGPGVDLSRTRSLEEVY
ncbi:MAG: amidohydrolase, partial [Vicinamibacterales bacterium]